MWGKLVLMMILLIHVASAATIHGNVYDYSLNILKDAKVEIDTTPQQVMVSKDGSYSFSVPVGEYQITASSEEIGTKEKLTVVDDGTYTLDLILIESVDEDTELLQDEGISIDPSETGGSNNYLMFSIIILAAIMLMAGITYLAQRFIKARNYDEDNEPSKEKASDDKIVEGNLDKLVKIIKDEGGRATQKDIRKRLGLSEAKISLMVAELESKGIVKKIKKGRGNIIILS
ncbi:MAG: carboxypeptidase regulatory-like domain-containing protein [Candidatus Woesearchaeota archaeon]